MRFTELLARVRSKNPDWRPPSKLLALDPGETLGWALFTAGELTKCGQLTMTAGNKRLYLEPLRQLMVKAAPAVVVCENYRVYAWKRNEHTWSSLFTPKLIGAIEMQATQLGAKVVYQMANTAKGFCSDAKLKEWDYYVRGQQHSRDAIRHGCYWLLFGREAPAD